MEDTIKLHEICGYLPYGVKINAELSNKPYNIMTLCDKTGLSNLGISDFMDDVRFFKPLLRPLSDLTKEIEHNGDVFVPIVKLLQEYCFDTNQMTEQEINEYAESMIKIDMSYMVAQMLMEWHFDIHGLINRNLALNLNDYEI